MVFAAPIDWSARYDAIYSWAFGATGVTTRWADQDEARPDFPYLLLDVIATGKEGGGVDEIRRTTDLTRARDVVVTPIAQDDTTYSVTINGTLFTFLSDASATVAEITAGLVAAITAGAEPVTATDNTTDFDVVGDFETLNPTVPQLFTIVVSDDFAGANIGYENNDAGNEVQQEVTGSREFTLNVQAFERNTRTDNPGTDPDRNAHNMLTILQSSLGMPTVQKQLRDANIAMIEELPITDLSAVVEDSFLSRASMDIRMRTPSILLEYTGFVEDVSGTGTYSGAKVSPITQTYSVVST